MKQCKELEIKEAEISELKAANSALVAENADLRSRNVTSKDVAAERKKTEAAEAKAEAEAKARAEAEARAKAENERAEEYKKLLIANGIAVPA